MITFPHSLGLLFSAFTYYAVNKKQPEISKVFYTELISPYGKKISGGKFMIENSFGSGYLIIPKNIITGNYFIRAYTKYMRNNNPETYCYIPIKIINPFKKEVSR